MSQILKLHPDSRCDAVSGIAVDVARPRAGALELRYVVKGAVEGVRLPPKASSVRSDELWRHTCFEIFVRTAPRSSYAEFNFAPSTAWAAYAFDSYRSGMSAAREIETPRITVESTSQTFALKSELDVSGLTFLTPDAPWQLALSAVIEEINGRLCYWALAHPPGKPDFHHSDCFALELPAPSRA